MAARERDSTRKKKNRENDSSRWSIVIRTHNTQTNLYNPVFLILIGIYLVLITVFHVIWTAQYALPSPAKSEWEKKTKSGWRRQAARESTRQEKKTRKRPAKIKNTFSFPGKLRVSKNKNKNKKTRKKKTVRFSARTYLVSEVCSTK